MIEGVIFISGLTAGMTGVLIWLIVDLRKKSQTVIAEAQAIASLTSATSRDLTIEIEKLKDEVKTIDFWRQQGKK